MILRNILKNRIISFALASVMVVTALTGCQRKEPSDPDAFKIFYVNNSETGIMAVDYEIQSSLSDTEAVIAELIEQLGRMSERRQYEAPLTGEVNLIGYSIADKLLTLNFDTRYLDIGRTVEVLDRAAIVRTFTQLDEIEYVSFQVEGAPLTDHYGNIIGNMSADTFIFNVGNEINTYEKVELKLFFANETGDKLVPVYRSVVYNSNISMERLAVEQIISGPNTDICYPTISKDSKINSVNVKDGVCYIDFDSAFLSEPYNVTAEVALYSLVNTVAEFSDVNKVAFSVNGESAFTFMDFSISGPYERNLDIIEGSN
ncbi:GerMN domain-containing protein [Butyrivibrio sp. CB08]|uniref:GerMN domain-containing protein n=1 Tax=Butyrivibrio sp. CB08 TaxID=2364879 RepID=UPI0013146A66|nr:GerMN domain-containing protein [Butyrivibrio sp. CB08]